MIEWFYGTEAISDWIDPRLNPIPNSSEFVTPHWGVGVIHLHITHNYRVSNLRTLGGLMGS